MFEPEVLRKQRYRVEESTYDIVGTFPRLGNYPLSRCAPGLEYTTRAQNYFVHQIRFNDTFVQLAVLFAALLGLRTYTLVYHQTPMISCFTTKKYLPKGVLNFLVS